MALVSGQLDCWRQTFLFVHRETSGCSRNTRCQNDKGIPYGNNSTLCLVRFQETENTCGNQNTIITFKLLFSVKKLCYNIFPAYLFSALFHFSIEKLKPCCLTFFQLKCPKNKISEETYEIQLIFGIQQENLQLRGFRIYRGTTYDCE